MSPDIGIVIQLIEDISSQLMGTTIQSITFNREESDNYIYDVLLTNGDTVSFSVPINDDFGNIFLIASGNTNEADNGNFRITIGSNNRFQVQRRELGAWVTKGEFGDSVDTDKVFASGTSGGVLYRNSDGTTTYIGITSDLGNRIEFGDENRQTYLVGNEVTQATRGERTTEDYQTGSGDSVTLAVGTSQVIFNDVIPQNGAIVSLEVNTGGIAKARLEVRDVTDNLIIHDPITAGLFDLGEGFTVAAGIQVVTLLEPIRIIGGHTYEATLYNATVENGGTDITINGDAGTPFEAYVRYTIDNVTFAQNTNDGNVVTQIEAKVGEDRLSYNSLKDQPNIPTMPTIRTDEDIRDVIGSALVAGSGITINIDDSSDTITISSSGAIPPIQADSTNYLQFTANNLVSSLDINTALNSDNLNPTLTLPTLTENGYIQMLQSMQHSEFSSISIGGLNQKGAFDIVDNARVIGGQQYRHYVSSSQLVGTVLSGEIIALGGAS